MAMKNVFIFVVGINMFNLVENKEIGREFDK